MWIGWDQCDTPSNCAYHHKNMFPHQLKMGPIVSPYLQLTVKGNKQTWVIGSDKMCLTQCTSCTVSLMLNLTSCLRLPHPRNPPALLIGNAPHSSKTCSRQRFLFSWYFCLPLKPPGLKWGCFCRLSIYFRLCGLKRLRMSRLWLVLFCQKLLDSVQIQMHVV